MPSLTTPALDLKFTPLDFKAVAADGAFEGYASLFNKEDLGHDIVAPGAFRDSLSQRGPTGEHFGHQPADGSGDVYFHLDPLWSSANIDAVAIDVYWPLADWRDGADHLDRQAGVPSASELALLAGANLAAVENADGDWEVLQFQSAVLTAPATYRLSLFLRGQAGTEAAMRAPLAAGARFVLLDGAPTLVDMSQDEIGLDYIWRCGPANRDIGHASYLETTHAFAGVGLRPLSPAHVRGSRTAGDLSISWVRRTRLGGDNWDAAEVPLGEETERYEVDILDGATVKRTLATTTPAATYTAAQQTADFGSPQSAIDVRVFQLSAVHGRGTPHPATL